MQTSNIAHCLVGGGELGELMRSYDWSSTPLGAVETWSQALQLSVSLCLNSRFPLILWWGPELTMLYNDPYAEHLQSKHPGALGRPGREVWAEIWPTIGPMLEGVFQTGEPTWSDDLRLLLHRNGFPEETYHTFSYSAIKDTEGRITGIFTPVAETTERVVGERRLQTLRNLSIELRAENEEAIYHSLGAVLCSNNIDLPFWGLLRVAQDKNEFQLLAGSSQAVLPTHGQLDESALGQVLRKCVDWQKLIQLERLSDVFANLPEGIWGRSPNAAILAPISVNKESEQLILFSALSPHRPWDENYQLFFESIAKELARAIAELRVLEDERKRGEMLAELDRAKTTFFNNVSHEFRTPLTLMLGPLESLVREDVSPTQVKSEASVAYRNALRLLRMVNTLLDFSRIEAGRVEASYEPTDLSALTADLASSFRSAIEKSGLKYEINCPTLSEPAFVDIDMWEKIVLNLISNAFKFTIKGSISVNLTRLDQHFRLTVSDTGCGINTDDREHLFERFYRAKHAQARTHEGTGIGLSLVKQLIELHKGKIEVQSQEGVGTTVIVDIPAGNSHLAFDQVNATRRLQRTTIGPQAFLAEASRWGESQNIESSWSPPLQPGREGTQLQGTVLVADDNSDMRAYLVRLLSEHWTVLAVGDGSEALRTALERRPDLILTDVMMPGLDGFELLKAIRTDPRTSTMPVILLSARAGEEARVEGLGAGADDYLTKPFSARELIACVGGNLKLAQERQNLLNQQETEKEQTAALTRSLVGLIPAAVLIIESDGNFELSNEYAERLFGPAKHMNFQTAAGDFGLYQSDQQTLLSLDALPVMQSLKGQVVRDAEIFVRNQYVKSGAWISVSASPLRDKQGDINAALLICVDITERKKQSLQTFSEVTLANEELRALAHVVSHELQEPCTTIRSYHKLLAVRYADKLGPDADQFIKLCSDASFTIDRMIEDLWTYARITSEQDFADVDMTRILGSVLHSLSDHIKDKNSLIIDEQLPLVRANERQMIDLLKRLIENSLKYAHVNPLHIKISAKPLDPDKWEISVTDNGRGLDVMLKQDVLKLFNRAGKRPGHDGTGMGLGICKKIVEHHGGHFRIESNVGAGLKAVFTLSAAKASPPK